MSGYTHRPFILSVYPTSRGFAFVLFEAAEAPFDWGSKEIRERKKNQKTLEKIEKLLDRYQPEALVIEDTRGKSVRSERVMRLYRMILHLAETKAVPVFRYSKQEVRQCFSSVGASTKYEIALAIAEQIPSFLHRLPPIRKIWKSADARQALFDAAALGITHYMRNTTAKE